MTGAGESIGNFEALQETHDRLTEAYVLAHRSARGFWARPVVDGHLRDATESLRDAYIQARETTFRSQERRKWLDAEIDALEALKPTFDREWGAGAWLTGVTTVFGLPGLTSALAATGVSAAVLTILRSCLCHLVVLVPIVITCALVLTFVVGFYAKRKLFQNTPHGVAGGIYALEANAFAALGEKERQERPLDVVGWALTTLAWLIASVVGNAAMEKGLFINNNFFLMYIFTGFFAVITLLTFIDWRQRVARQLPAM